MLNSVCLIGRLTADPELKRTPSGTSVCSFCIAVDRDFKGRDGERQADFINISAWRATAEFIEKYFVKGQSISVHGSIQTRRYRDKNGNNRTIYEVVADSVYFAGNNPGN